MARGIGKRCNGIVEDVVSGDSLYLFLEIGVIGQLDLAIVVKYRWETWAKCRLCSASIDWSWLFAG